ncbi:MAG: S-layer homology domain-containing protein [Clostridia bacterium]|nr:S-layer homology domain-containing protein [Clostridia bacterium]
MRIRKIQRIIGISMIMILALATTIFAAPVGPMIEGYDGTSVDYDETAGTPVVIAPTVSITDPVGFDENGYVEFAITDSKSVEDLDFQRVSSTAEISTGSGIISIYGDLVYKGNGSEYDAIAGIDSVKDGQNGQPLRINFSRELENASFKEGPTGSALTTETLPGWSVESGTFDLTANGLNLRSLGRSLTFSASPLGSPLPYTVNGLGYSYQTDFDYSTGDSAWYYESVERIQDPPNLRTTVMIDTIGSGDSRSLKLSSTGQVVSGNGTPQKYGSTFGPVVRSAEFSAKAGETLSLDWKAQYNGDHYEVYGYIKNTTSGVYTLLFYGRGQEISSWVTSTSTIPGDGTYQFVFINGTYDKTGGYAVGSELWIDNINVYGDTYADDVVEAIALKATYVSDDKDPPATRTVNLTVVNANGQLATESATINITNQFDHAPELTATAQNPCYNTGTTSADLVFSSASSDTIEADQSFAEITMTVSGLVDGSDEILVIGGEDIELTDQNSGTITSTGAFNVSVADSTATLELSAMTASENDLNSLVNGIEYKNTKNDLTPGQRVVTITKIKDSGGSTGADSNETSLSISSTVFVSQTVDDLSRASRESGTIGLQWTTPLNPSSVVLMMSANGGSSWTTPAVSIVNDAGTSTTTVSGLSDTTQYKFKLMIIGSNHGGISDILTVPAGSSNVEISSGTYVVDGTEMRDVDFGTSKADFLSNLSKSHSGQTWDADGLSDPVLVGDTLIVIAEDGIRRKTYTITSYEFGGFDVTMGSVQDVNTSFWVTVTALDVEGNPFYDFDGTIRFTTSDANSFTTIPEAPVSFAGGSDTFSFEANSAGTYWIEAADTTNAALRGIYNGLTINRRRSSASTKPEEDPGVRLIPDDGQEATLTGQNVKDLEGQEQRIEVRKGDTTYAIAASQINIDDVSAQFGEDIPLEDIDVKIIIKNTNEDQVRVIEDEANKNNFLLVVPPVDFEITCEHNGRSVTVSRFNSYVERTIAIPDGVDPNQITTGVIINEDGTFSHVPTTIIMIDGKYYARINSLTNSTYSVIYNPMTFSDLDGYWAEDIINNMGARLIVKGTDDNMYEPELDITRAEFATMTIRALGLIEEEGTTNYKDVDPNEWYNGYIKTATTYGLINGYEVDEFGPNDKIIREDAMVIISRAMDVIGMETELEQEEIDTLLVDFKDVENALPYIRSSIAACLKANIIKGRYPDAMEPKDNIIRAEVAVILSRMLKAAELINE